MLIELRKQPNFVENFLLYLALFRAKSRVHRFPKMLGEGEGLGSAVAQQLVQRSDIPRRRAVAVLVGRRWRVRVVVGELSRGYSAVTHGNIMSAKQLEAVVVRL